MKYIIYSDIHFYAPHELKLKGQLKHGPGVIYLGDNFDIKNTKKSELKKAQVDLTRLIEACKLRGSTFLSGNHELMQVYLTKIIVDPEENKKVLFLHGDLIAYGPAKMVKWRNKKPGISILQWFARKLMGKRKGRRKKLSQDTIKKAYQVALLYDVDVICFGHYHVSELFKTEYSGITIISVPRGETLVSI